MVAPTDSLTDFHQFVGQQISNGRNMTPELALALWREKQREVEAIREGLDDIRHGRATPLETVLSELDAEFGLGDT